MDGRRANAVAAVLGGGATRRRVVRAIGGAAAGGLVSLLGGGGIGRVGARRQLEIGVGNLANLLPTEAEVPRFLYQFDEGGRSEAAITNTFANPAEATRRFLQWEWLGNAYRHFGAPSGGSTANGTTLIEVSLHLFGSPGAAAEALPYFAEARAVALGIEPLAVDTFGDQAAAIGGEVAAGTEVTLYVRRGVVLARVSGTSPGSDPGSDVGAVAEVVLARIGPDPFGRSVGVFAADDWIGGFYRGDQEWYGRRWVAVYGARSDYPRATLSLTLDAVPVGDVGLALHGLDDELLAKATIAVSVNGERIYADASPFANWDAVGQGENAAWTRVLFSVSADLFGVGSNEIAVANLEPNANFSAPPYVLLGEASVELGFG